MMNNNKVCGVLLVACVVLLGSGSVFSATIGYDYTTMTNQPAGSSYRFGVGHRFVPDQSLEVSALGFAAWEPTQTGVIPAGAPDVTIQLYEYDAVNPDNSTLLATATFPAGTASVEAFDPGDAGGYIAYVWRSALASLVQLDFGKDYMVAGYNFSGSVSYLNGPTGVTVAPTITQVRSYYNASPRGVGDAPNNGDAFLQYAGPTFEFLPLPPPPPFNGIVIDNEESGFSVSAAATGSQLVPAAYGDSQRWFSSDNGEGWAKYDFSDVPDGVYDVYASWRDNGAGNLDEQTTYTLSDGGGAAVVNQRIHSLGDLVMLDPLDDVVNLQLLTQNVTIADGNFTVTITAPTPDMFAFADAVALQLVPEPSGVLLAAFALAAFTLGASRRRKH